MNKSIFLLTTLLYLPTTFASGLPAFPFVSVVGVSEQDVAPDIATLHIHLEAFDQHSDVALQQVNSASQKVIDAMGRHNIALKNLAASDIHKAAHRERSDRYVDLKILGYEVSRRMTLTLENLDNYSALMASLAALDNVTDLRTQFDVSSRAEIEATLIKQASIDARRQADQLASGLSTQVKSVYAISQKNDFGNLVASFSASPAMLYDLQSPNRAGTTAMFAPKSIAVTQVVNVVFKLK